jgi:hypothetical protein
MNRSIALVLMTAGLAVGCSSGPNENTSGGGQGQGGSSTDSVSSTSGSAEASSGSGVTSGNALGATVDKDVTLTGDVEMPVTSTINAGVTVTLSAGARLLASKDAALIVKGSLVAEGMDGKPVIFQSKEHAGPSGWVGIEVQDGGKATLTRVDFHDAKVAFQADVNSTFAIDYILVDTSAKIATLNSGGTLGHGTLHALGAAQMGSPITIDAASPKVSDTLVDQANATTDHIKVSGVSAGPVFDHMDVSQCHCAFHFSAGKDATISNSVAHDSQFGLMVIASVGTKVTNTNFVNNTNNIGTCVSGGDVTATGNYFDDAAFDTSCATQTNTTPSTTPIADVGPRP